MAEDDNQHPLWDWVHDPQLPDEERFPESGYHLSAVIEPAIEMLDLYRERLLNLPDKARVNLKGAAISSIGLFLLAANSIDGGARVVKTPSLGMWNEILINQHKAFFSWLHSATEVGLTIVCYENGWTVENSIKKSQLEELEKLEKKLHLEGEPAAHFAVYKKKLQDRTMHPLFEDYSNKIIAECPISKKEKRQWRAFFSALSTIRNKASHSDVRLSEVDLKKIREGGLDDMVSW